MRFLKCTLLAVLSFLTSLTATAQITEEAYQEAKELGYRPYPYSFVQLQAGVGVTPTNKSFGNLLSPTVSLAYGRFFGSGVGARFHLNGWQSKGGFKSIDETYKFNYINANADLLLNLTNIFSKSNHHKLDVILVAGVGLNYAWNNDDLDKILEYGPFPAESTSNAWGEGKSRESLYSHNIRAGFIFDYNISKNWSVGLELDANSLSDRFNSKYSNKDDWMITAQIGVTYKFGFKPPRVPDPIIEKKVIVPPAEEEDDIEVVYDDDETETETQTQENQNVVLETNTETEPETQNVEVQPVETVTPVVTEPEVVPYKVEIFYLESKREANEGAQSDLKVEWVKEWADRYPTKGKIRVIGYADKGTGIPERNMRYSQERADNIAKALIEAGVPEDMIVEVKGVGDTEQPFEQNEFNRCVIVYCEEK